MENTHDNSETGPRIVAMTETSEAKVRKDFEALFGEYFELFPEVWMQHTRGDRLRIDYLAHDPSGAIQGLIGFELKKGDLAGDDYGSLSKAVAQCIDYAHSRVATQCKDHADWYDRQPRFVFLFPFPYNCYELRNDRQNPVQRDLWAQGALKMAGEYGVGAAYYDEKKADWGLFLGGHPAFWLASGPTVLMTKHALNTKKGAAR